MERFDTHIYRVEKHVKEMIDNFLLSPYHRKELQMKGREIETIVKNANLSIEENIMEALTTSCKNLIKHFSSFNESLYHISLKGKFPKYHEHILKHQDILLENLKILKEKLNNSIKRFFLCKNVV